MPRRERDSQKHKVYAWEKSSFLEPFWDKNLSMNPNEVRNLCRQILIDAKAPSWQLARFETRFTMRKGNAEANHNYASFTPSYLPKIIVIHEMAHALTWGMRDFQGHGPKYVSCYMALLEKYLNLNINDLASSLRRKIEKVVHQGVYIDIPVKDERTNATKMIRKVVYEKRTKKINPPTFDAHELSYWRERLELK